MVVFDAAPIHVVRQVVDLPLVIAVGGVGVSRQSKALALPDRDAVKVPDVSPSSDPEIQKQGHKFYYFHNPNVNFSEAVADFRECRSYLQTGQVKIPGFIPFGVSEARNKLILSSPFGLVGDIAGSVIYPNAARGPQSNKMRRCMETRGYARYAIPKSTWEQLNAGSEEDVVLQQAKVATGPTPDAEAVTE